MYFARRAKLSNPLYCSLQKEPFAFMSLYGERAAMSDSLFTL